MTATISPLAGSLLDAAKLVDAPRLVRAYYNGRPDPSIPAQRVSFGTSGHRGSSFDDTFSEAHLVAISEALCDHRCNAGITGPVFVGIDTHALSRPALPTAIEVLAANDVDVVIDQHDGYTPAPVISHAILTYNRGRTGGPCGRHWSPCERASGRVTCGGPARPLRPGDPNQACPPARRTRSRSKPKAS